MGEERYLSAKDIQTRLAVGRARAYEVIAQMPRVKFGASVRVSESAFAMWLKAHEVPAPPAVAQRMRIAARNAAQAPLDEMPIRPTAARDRKTEPSEPFRIRPSRPRT